ncbi:hypothetical protein SKAU_G00293480 [Synaphobranchus kaupii]|uniref:Ig-like domain-containing protein n=1 Tax=Synaphobranchus kaupii TaxID=118154 RepID=A0A9Q1EUA0_SYNKA|nr:hypothetical protein SKAU_G00293480 [Synaphobranchus kaupii]
MTLQICVLIGLLFVPQAASQDIPEVISVSLGHPLTLSCGGSSRRDVLWYFKQYGQDHWHLLAKLQDGALSTGSVFQGRVEKLENYNITISSVVYNDKGIYECKHKDGTVLSDVKVDILSPSDVSIVNGMSASLPCYGNIDKGGRTFDLDILWKKGEKTVYHLHDDTITYGDGFENRASLSTKLALQGNLSLTIRETRFSDQGEYQCFYNRQKGNPDSVSLVVLVTGAVAGIMLAVLAVLALAVAVGFVYKRFKNRESGSTFRHQGAQAVDQNGSDSRACRASLLPDDLELQQSVSETQPTHTKLLLPVSENEPSPPEPRLPVTETQPDLTKIQAKSAEEL